MHVKAIGIVLAGSRLSFKMPGTIPLQGYTPQNRSPQALRVKQVSYYWLSKKNATPLRHNIFRTSRKQYLQDAIKISAKFLGQILRYYPIYKIERFCAVIVGEKPVTNLPPFSVRKKSTNLSYHKFVLHFSCTHFQ